MYKPVIRQLRWYSPYHRKIDLGDLTGVDIPPTFLSLNMAPSTVFGPTPRGIKPIYTSIVYAYIIKP